MKLLLLGFGNVGRRLAEILVDRASYPGLRDLDVSIVGITTGSRGGFADPDGLDLRRVLAEPGRFALALPSEEVVRVLAYDVAVEMTPACLPRLWRGRACRPLRRNASARRSTAAAV